MRREMRAGEQERLAEATLPRGVELDLQGVVRDLRDVDVAWLRWFEELAVATYEGLDFDARQEESGPELAQAALGSCALVHVDPGEPVGLVRTGGEWCIAIPRGGNAVEVNEVTAEGVARWVLRRTGNHVGDVESATKLLAGALLVPAAALSRAIEEVGADARALADRFVVPVRLILLRAPVLPLLMAVGPQFEMGPARDAISASRAEPAEPPSKRVA